MNTYITIETEYQIFSITALAEKDEFGIIRFGTPSFQSNQVLDIDGKTLFWHSEEYMFYFYGWLKSKSNTHPHIKKWESTFNHHKLELEVIFDEAVRMDILFTDLMKAN